MQTEEPRPTQPPDKATQQAAVSSLRELAEPDAAWSLVGLVVRGSPWLRRVTQEISFSDDRTLRWLSSIEGSIDSPASSDNWRLPTVAERAALPVALHPRGQTSSNVVVGRDQHRLPFLTRREERTVLARGIATWAMHTIPELKSMGLEPLSSYILLRIDSDFCPPEDVKEADDSKITALMQSSTAGEAVGEAIEMMTGQRSIIALPPQDEIVNSKGEALIFRLEESHAEGVDRPLKSASALDVVKSAVLARRFQPRDFFPLVAGQWRESLDVEPLIVTYSRKEAVPGEGGDARGEWHRLQLWGDEPPDLPLPWQRRPQIDDYYISISVGQLQRADSNHVQFKCPPGMYVADAHLVVTVAGSTEEATDPTQVAESDDKEHATVATVVVSQDDPHWDQAHLFFSPAMIPDHFSTVTESNLIAVLRPMYHGAMRGGAVLSAVTSGVLFVLAFTAGWASTDWPVPAYHLEVSATAGDSVVALLLMLPVTALALMIREEEHLLIKRVLIHFRRRLAIVAFATFAAGFIFALGLQGAGRFWGLLGAGVVALMPASLIGWSAWISRTDARVGPLES